MQLVWEMYCTDGCTYSNTDFIPFEFSSKDDFIYFILEKIKEVKAKKEKYPYIKLFGYDIALFVNDATYLTEEDVERNVHTLEEWFANNKKEIF